MKNTTSYNKIISIFRHTIWNRCRYRLGPISYIPKALKNYMYTVILIYDKEANKPSLLQPIFFNKFNSQSKLTEDKLLSGRGI